MSKNPFLPVSAPSLSEADARAVAELVREGWASGDAPIVKKFEESVAQLTNRSYGTAVNSGTSALDIAVFVSGVGPGDEVIMPSFTIVSCLTQVLRSGAKPVFIDSDPHSWNVTARAFESAITPVTRLAIIPHIYGLAAEIAEIEELCKKHGIILVEDAAEGLGLSIHGRPAGSFGDMSIVSFYANKVITTGEGGMVLTNQEGLHAQLARARNLGFNETRRFVHEDAAWVYRMPALSAALGYSQVERFKELLSDQIERGNHYQELLHSVRGIRLPAKEWGGVQNIYWVFGFVLDPELGVDARSFMNRLLEVGIGSRPFFYPLHRQPVLEKFGWANQPSLNTSEALGDFGLYVPSLGTTREDRQRVAAVISGLIEG